MILKDNLIDKVLDVAMSKGADFAEIYAEKTYESTIKLKDSMPSEGITGRLFGAGIRLFFGMEEIYTYTNDLSEKGLIECAKRAAAVKAGQPQNPRQPLKIQNHESIHNFKTLPWEMSKDHKVALLSRADKAARSRSSYVTQVMPAFRETHKRVQIANSLGVNTSETRQYVHFGIQTIIEKDGNKEAGSERVGKFTSSDFLETINYEDMANKAVDAPLTMVTADYAPAAELPVIIDNGFGGVIFHEACGHGLETTSISRNTSVFCGKMGEKIAHECVTAIDDGTIKNENGSLMIDDEGTPSQKTTLIENGILKSYLVDRLGSIKTGFKMTGSGRRQDYRFSPTSRMRNTFIAPGDSNLDEMIKDLDYGIYAKDMGGGSVSPGTGAFNFAVREAYLVENGKITKPLKGASLIGTGIETLGRITKVGKNFELAAGTCGSVSGMIPTTVGQPAILVSKMTVGGRA